MKSCIIFAVSVFNKHKLHVLTEFLDVFKKHFTDCDIYVGINYGSLKEVEDVLASYNLCMYTARVENGDLYTGSDASAYQAALSILKQKNTKYDIYWFAHTKGAVNDRPVERDMYLTELFSNREYIENLFKQYTKLGSYALRGVSISAANDSWDTFNRDHHIDICSNTVFGNFKFTHVNWSYIETMYAIKGDIISNFLENTCDKFYTTQIQEPCYFEVIFPWTVSRCGYFPYIKQDRCFWGTYSIKAITQQWIEQNNLTELQQYMSI